MSVDSTNSPFLKVSADQANTLSHQSFQSRVNNYMGHAFEMVDALHKQAQSSAHGKLEEINQIFQNAKNEISNIQKRILSNDKIQKGNIKALKKELEKAEKDIAKIIQNAQIDTAAVLGAQGYKKTGKYLKILAKNGWGTSLIKFLAVITKSTSAFNQAVKGLPIAQQRLDNAIYKKMENFEGRVDQQKMFKSDSEIEKLSKSERESFLKNRSKIFKLRAGVVGVSILGSDGIYQKEFRIQTQFDTKGIRKQFKSFIAQNMSLRERTTIEADVPIGRPGTPLKAVKSRLVPLNSTFDKYINLQDQDREATTVFGEIFGSKGLSSLHRAESHVVNAWESTLTEPNSGKQVYRVLRHGILSSGKNQKNTKIREQTSQTAAREIVTAAFMQQIKDMGLTPEQAAKQNPPIVLNLNSVSLVTPMNLPFFTFEKRMLNDQRAALKAFEKEGQNITIGSIRIPVKVNVNSFNFGVNAGAVKAPGLMVNQYKENKKALEGLKKQYTETYQALEKETPQRTALMKEMSQLMKDIETLMTNSRAYIKGQNQYILASNIIHLSNLMDEARSPQIPGAKCMINCMSGKDRTGILDAVAKAKAAVYAETGHYPTLAEIRDKNSDMYKLFQSNFISMLVKSGNLEILETNTGARGYKVNKEVMREMEALGLQEFVQIKGLASTTSS